MAMTLDKLFNFDEKTLARQIMRENKYKAQADADKHGWGNTVSGFSRLVDNTIGPGGALGVKDPLLEKSSKIEAILRDSSNLKNEDGTDMSSLQLQKSILNRMQQDPSLGKEALLLSEKISVEQAAANKIAYDRGIKEIELGNTLDTAQSNKEEKWSKQEERLIKQIERNVKVNANYWKDEIMSVLKPMEEYLDFEGDTTGRALEALTMQLISGRKTDKNGTPTGLMFHSLQQAKDVAKDIIRKSKPEAGLTWWHDDEIDMVEIQRLAINEVSSRQGRPENLSTKRSEHQESLIAPKGLSADNQEAWDWSVAKLKTHPEDADALKILELLRKPK
jgi:hypothetical protein|tara:strand:- start:396 stop:1397 length:1002 start_codon:yes stop_codon:yes gene_type:complete